MYMHHFARPVSGVWVECRVLFLIARKACQVIVSTKDMYRNQQYWFTILVQSWLGWIKSKLNFDPEYERYVNIEGYDRISQYYLRPDDSESEDDSSV